MMRIIRSKSSFNWRRAAPFSAITLVVGVVVVLAIFASGTPIAFETEAGTLSNVTNVTDATASGGHAIQFGAGGGTGACQGSANTPGGSDGMGGCFPGAATTGYPHGLPGDTRTPVTLTSYTGSCTIAAGTTVTISDKSINCGSSGFFIYGTLNLSDSLVTGSVYENSNNAVLNLSDTEVNGGNQYEFPTVGGANNVTAIRVNSYGGEHTVQCYADCDIENSWLHDQFEAGSGPHQNGFLSNGGSNFTLEHNSLYCAPSGCTSDVAFTDDDVTSNATIDKNLFVAAPLASYCLDVGTVPSKNNPEYQMHVTNNVFQKGSNGKCAAFGPTYGWDATTTTPGTTGYQNSWSGNKWDDGTVLDHP